VAFIPIQLSPASDPRIVGLLQSASERFSIAVHGCDHAASEYSSTDLAWLEGTTACALDRMEQHQRRPGCRRHVMFFPKAVFHRRHRCSEELAASSPQSILALGRWIGINLHRLSAMPLDVAVTSYERFRSLFAAIPAMSSIMRSMRSSKNLYWW